MPTALIIGAYSDIAVATAYELARQNYDLQLALRGAERMEEISADLVIRHAINVQLLELDILEMNTFNDFVTNLTPVPDVVICAVGLLGDQHRDQQNIIDEVLVMRTNFEGPACLLGKIATVLIERGAGTIIGISSVAGERGRASNYIYGASKAGFTAYLSGMRNRCFKHGVRVVTILPGFVDTKMTAGLNLPKKLTAQPSDVGKVIVKALSRNSDVIYVKSVWAAIMTIVKGIPEKLFKRLTL
jgi:decaprenylphospho-beta-D-erythro-pentofuranosid-2-ulose 2-reductase|tara:strand:- start:1291 stop:2022 length:732 start_codon:yes stop_codon:yes gene_type:complete